MGLPSQVPFDSMEPVLWRLVAPLGYAWDFAPGDFLFRRQDEPTSRDSGQRGSG